MKNKSFTLIELLVVIVIIGILAGVIMISTSSSIDKANIAKSKVFEESVQNSLAANMVSRWTLDEVIGTAAPFTTPDAWGNKIGILEGTVIPQLQAAGCVSGNCLSFNGAGYINVGSVISDTLNGTITVWARILNDTTSYTGIVCSDLKDFSMWRQSAQSLYSAVNTDLHQFAWAGESYNEGEWHFYVTTYDGNSIKVFQDGQQRGSLAYAGNIPVITQTLIGSYATTIGFFNGSIDDARIYSAALSSSQIKQNYIAGLNSMLSNGNISNKEYNERINELAYGK